MSRKIIGSFLFRSETIPARCLCKTYVRVYDDKSIYISQLLLIPFSERMHEGRVIKKFKDKVLVIRRSNFRLQSLLTIIKGVKEVLTKVNIK